MLDHESTVTTPVGIARLKTELYFCGKSANNLDIKMEHIEINYGWYISDKVQFGVNPRP